MAFTSNGIYYPDTGTQLSLHTILAQMAQSVDTELASKSSQTITTTPTASGFASVTYTFARVGKVVDLHVSAVRSAGTWPASFYNNAGFITGLRSEFLPGTTKRFAIPGFFLNNTSLAPQPTFVTAYWAATASNTAAFYIFTGPTVSNLNTAWFHTTYILD